MLVITKKQVSYIVSTKPDEENNKKETKEESSFG